MKKAALFIVLALAVASCGKDNLEQEAGPAVQEEDFVVTKIEYHLDDSAVIEQLPDYVAEDQLWNNTPEIIPASRTFVFDVENSSSFINSGDVSVSVPEEFYAPIPCLVAETNSIYLTEPRRHMWGENTATPGVKTVEVSMNTAPYSRLNVTVIIKRYRMSVRYTAYLRGMSTGREISIDGVWEGIYSTDTETLWTQHELE